MPRAAASPARSARPRPGSSRAPSRSPARASAPAAAAVHRVADHFEGRAPEVRATYDAILAASKRLGLFHEEAKKTSIHLVRKSAFAGVATRKAALILTVKSDVDRPGARVFKREQVSSSRWHLEVKLERPADVDRELAGWLERAYALSG